MTARPLVQAIDHITYVNDLADNFFWSSASPNTGQDINFNGHSTDVLHGHDEWDGTERSGRRLVLICSRSARSALLLQLGWAGKQALSSRRVAEALCIPQVAEVR